MKSGSIVLSSTPSSKMLFWPAVWPLASKSPPPAARDPALGSTPAVNWAIYIQFRPFSAVGRRDQQGAARDGARESSHRRSDPQPDRRRRLAVSVRRRRLPAVDRPDDA